MSAATLSPPPAAVCLTRSYVSRGIKGGTVVAEGVTTVAEHEVRLQDPDRYRPDRCLACNSRRVHAHCFRERKLRPEGPNADPVIVTIRLFRCAEDTCGAVFTVLPAFIARHLWRSWKTVEEVVGREKSGAPRRTVRRWLGRLASDASQLVEVFAATVAGAVTTALTRYRSPTRAAFVAVMATLLNRETGSALAPIAAWIHRIEAGIRLM